MGKMKHKKANKKEKDMAEQSPMTEKEKKKMDKKKSESQKNDTSMASLDQDEDEVFRSTKKTKRKYEDIVTAPETSPKKSKKKKKLNNMEALYDGMKSPPSTSKKKKHRNSDDNIPQDTQPIKVKKEKKMVDDNLDFPDGNMEDLEKENTNTPTTKSKKKKNTSPMVMLPTLLETGKEKSETPLRRTPKQEDFSPPRSMKRQQEQEDLNCSSSGSPRKKKRKSMLVGDATSSELPKPLLKVFKTEDEHHIGSEEEDKEIWSNDETRTMLDRIEEQLPPRDRRGYRTSMNKIDWGNVATDNRSDEECRLKLLNLISRFQRLLTMKEMVQNLRKLVNEGRAHKQVRRPSAFNIFMKHYLTPRQREKIKAKNSKEPMLSCVVKAWRKLPPEQQQVFKMQADEKKLKWDRMKKKPSKSNRKIKTGFVMSPYKAWLEEQMKAGVTDNKILTKDYFNKLSDQKKVPYITTSVQTYYQKFIGDGKDVESIKVEEEDGDEEEEKASTKQCRVAIGVGLPKSDLLIYLQHKGMPSLPPSTPARYYHSELTKNGDLDEGSTSQAMDMYRQLSTALKKTYNTQHAELLWKLKPVLESWMQSQDPVTVFAMRQYMGPFVHKYLLTTKATLRTVKNVQKIKVEMEELFPNVTRSSITCPKFHNEPQRPPFTPYQLFCLQFKQATEGKFATFKDQNEARNKKWKKMSVEKRKAYIEHLQRLQKSYRSELVEFVSDMDKKMRLVYLGFNRMRHYQYFKEDIFQYLFPNQKYPVYGIKNPTSKQDSFFGDGEADAISLDMKSEEEDEEQEDEEREDEEQEESDDDDCVNFVDIDMIQSDMNGKNKTSGGGGGVIRKTTKQQSPTTPQQQQQQKQQHNQSEENSSEEEEDDEEEVDDEEEDDDEEEEEEEDIPVMPRKRAVKNDGPKKTQPLLTPQSYPKNEESSSSSSESDDDDNNERPPTTSTPGSARVQRPPPPYPNADVSDDSDSDSDDFRNNSILPVYRTAKGAAVVSSARKTASTSSDSDSDSDSD